MEKNPKVFNLERLTQTVSPQKYDLDIYLDILNLRYEINEKITLKITDHSIKHLIVHALKNFKINKIQVSTDFDNISETFEYADCEFYYSDDLISTIRECKEKYKTYKSFSNNPEYQDELKGESSELSEEMFSNPHQMRSQLESFVVNNFLFDIQSPQESINVVEETIYIVLPKNLNFQLDFHIKFQVQGNVRTNGEGNGFYLSIFGKDSKILYSQEEFRTAWKDKQKGANLRKNAVFGVVCEPVEFRTIFPCFDEPCFKSIYNVRISIDEVYMEEKFQVLSNGEVSEVATLNGIRTYSFSPSPLMSLYLLTWVIGNMEYLETSNKYKIQIRVFTPINGIDDGLIALNLASKALDFYSDYFNIPYSFPKLDLIPLGDMKFRALENWGAITFKDYTLLMNSSLDIAERKTNSRTICHEISHMWFGNLVTMEWWDDIWLNEGFARYMEFVCLSNVQPQLKIWDIYIEKIFLFAFEIDERITTHPIQCNVPSARMIEEIFDTISYAKSSAVIRMLSYIVGEEIFQNIISNYLKKFSLKNAKTGDLWDCFDEFTGRPISQIMKSWVDNPGHPLVTVKLDVHRKCLIISQKALLPEKFPNSDNLVWNVPLFIKTKNNEFSYFLDKNYLEISLFDLQLDINDLLNSNDFIKINSNLKGFYRVFYDELLLGNLMKNLNRLSEYDIVGIFDDLMKFKDYFNCMKLLKLASPIETQLLLKIATNLYEIQREVLFQYNCFFDSKYQNLVNEGEFNGITYHNYYLITSKLNDFFANLVNFNREELKRSIFIHVDYHLYNESNDDIYNIILYYSVLIGGDKDMIKFIFENLDSQFHLINRNLKYNIYSIILKFNENKNYHYFNSILNEYLTSFFDLTANNRNLMKACLYNLSEIASEDFVNFSKKLVSNSDFTSIYFKNSNPFRNFPNNRLKFAELFENLISSNKNLTNDIDIPFLELNSHFLGLVQLFNLVVFDVNDKELAVIISEIYFKPMIDSVPEGDKIQIRGYLNGIIRKNFENFNKGRIERSREIIEKTFKYFN